VRFSPRRRRGGKKKEGAIVETQNVLQRGMGLPFFKERRHHPIERILLSTFGEKVSGLRLGEREGRALEYLYLPQLLRKILLTFEEKRGRRY